MSVFSCILFNTMYMTNIIVLPEKNTDLWAYFGCGVRVSACMIHTLYHKNKVSMTFPMTENLGTDTLIKLVQEPSRHFYLNLAKNTLKPGYC